MTTIEDVKAAYKASRDAVDLADHNKYLGDQKTDPDNAEINRTIALARIRYTQNKLQETLDRYFDSEQSSNKSDVEK